MNKQEWLAYAKSNEGRLKHIIARYHPLSSPTYKGDMPITAPNAERACSQVREDIRRNSEGDPLVKFDEALKNREWRTINVILNEVWFGVPESTLAWQIEGFKELIELIEEPPDDVL
jgi:hypothetical protein